MIITAVAITLVITSNTYTCIKRHLIRRNYHNSSTHQLSLIHSIQVHYSIIGIKTIQKDVDISLSHMQLQCVALAYPVLILYMWLSKYNYYFTPCTYSCICIIIYIIICSSSLCLRPSIIQRSPMREWFSHRGPNLLAGL